MEQIFKYPRTRHLEGSRQQLGDADLNVVKLEEIKGSYLVLEEKVDGANCGISFGRDGKMYLQSRGHFLNGGYGERQFDLFKVWASCFESSLHALLGDQYVMYGEWLFAGYGARVHVLYLEVPYQELFARNQIRARYIPEPALEDMIRKLEMPAPWEAYEVSWNVL